MEKFIKGMENDMIGEDIHKIKGLVKIIGKSRRLYFAEEI